jgi:hypothetical protein
MAVKQGTVKSPQIEALRKMDISMLIRMADLTVPRLLKGFLPILNARQRKAFDRVMPVGGGKRFYVHLLGTPTPPIVIQLAQPPKLCTMPEKTVRQQDLKGVRLTPDDLQWVANDRTTGNILKFLWRLRGQWITLLGISTAFMPFVWLGPGELRDMSHKAKKHFKPLIDLMPKK